MLDPVAIAEGAASGVATHAVVSTVSGPDTQLTELCRIRDLLDVLIKAVKYPSPDKHLFDRAETLIAGQPLDLAFDKVPPELFHVAIFVWGSAVVNVTIASGIGGSQVAIALPQNKWTALEFPFAPSSPMLTLAAGAPVPCVLRYADERWGSVLP